MTAKFTVRTLWVLVGCLGLSTPQAVAQEASLAYLDKLPPLIDRELFFGDPEIAGSQLSPDGRFVTFRKPYRDVMNIWIKNDRDAQVHDVFRLDLRTGERELTAAMERFLATHLGGRYQQDLPEETAERLAALTVDVSTVSLVERPSGADGAATAPLPLADGTKIRPGVAQYHSTLQTMGQEISLEITRSVAASVVRETAVWRVIDEVHSPMGVGVDTFELDRSSLKPIRRSAGGTGGLTLAFTDSTVMGELRMRGQSMPIEARLSAPDYGDESALALVLAALPLTDGYATTLRVFDVQTQQARPMSVTVIGTETTTTGAGTFETFVVEIHPLDDNEGGTATMYLMQEAPHLIVRSSTRLGAAMGGGTATTELVGLSTAASSTR